MNIDEYPNTKAKITDIKWFIPALAAKAITGVMPIYINKLNNVICQKDLNNSSGVKPPKVDNT
ncbi:hypothetical protein CSTERTH_04325 [Thermoclostridium stercorarium subsp. thermolacticum DSM 2910]|uniref:Uncharacterized protein n=2 Tax=Thermoclostridium stercorarium TaxID=1510 RepID=A0A1B1YJC3_THEST|nr:hypothetical protein CSTERTH_04325 [Thermoclostridium stercorarium subsp. thermolacticum DSM 2910]ANX00844.1 hypothetical protein CSTERLE_04230 [Thermoclostridium stercorarium subsp. leptospartum DSM 9219]